VEDERVSPERALADVRALLELWSEFDARLNNAVVAAWAVGVPRVVLARTLGVHRATLYRQYPAVQKSAGVS
jgi:hypothetical protein